MFPYHAVGTAPEAGVPSRRYGHRWAPGPRSSVTEEASDGVLGKENGMAETVSVNCRRVGRHRLEVEWAGGLRTASCL